MMHTHSSIERALRVASLILGGATAGLIAMSIWQANDATVSAYLVRSRMQEIPWKTLSMQQVASGATIPANTHVFFHLPENFDTIVRETLLGQDGQKARYWGYCFPQNYDPAKVEKRRGFPGLLFLSEKERAVRAEAERRAQKDFEVFDPPTSEEITERNTTSETPIRHQLEVFKPGTLCYIMSDLTLSIGLDEDGDRLNTPLEVRLGTDPRVPDTDGDGIIDGIEYRYHTDPTRRDTDGDGVIDGLEDANWNGRMDRGESDPQVRDTDRDGLCDGYCRTRVGREVIYLGEDKNLNGTLDDHETSPVLPDTDGDGIRDDVEVLTCLAENKQDCP